MNNPGIIQIEELAFQILISEDQIQNRINDLANIISREYEGKLPILVGVLNGAYLVMADLFRAMSID